MPASTDAPARPVPTLAPVLVATLALLTAVAPLSIDMYLPGFPAMAADLGTTASGIQLTMTAFLLGLGLGQLFIGPLSDGVGRRRPLLAGTALCLVASVVCAVAPNVEVLTGARFLQGVGGAAGVVLARAIVSDTSRGPVAAKLLGVLTIVSVIAPVVAPLVGGLIVAQSGWRLVFWVLAAVVAVMLVGSALRVRETLPVAHRTRGGIATTFATAREVLANRHYTGYALTFSFAFAGLFAYISASPFVVQNILGLSEAQFSLVFALNALAITATSAVSAGLAGRVPYRTMIGTGLAAMTLAGAGLLVTVLNGVPIVPTLVLFALFQGSLGLVFGNATALALGEAGRHAGTGSAFLGFLQFGLAAVVAPLVGIAGEATAVPMGIAMVVSAVLAVVSFVVLTRGATEPQPHTDDVVADDAQRGTEPSNAALVAAAPGA
ncbi:multidrug effflux MFS transporter [Cellulomonas sp. Sa3CUA2]|uniref:Multidrug effflux MFS transporter n=1 Tax=Cellulomonas avistercoris TaxID=2762242 RepID=A0ABR8QIS9_9CELL|nr:multidrug effflux MFS transporter [Cellulomonas avistercoris]MBD7920251.1 multidrug effflux MFS transporter [Cellulomonas avistercoris]